MARVGWGCWGRTLGGTQAGLEPKQAWMLDDKELDSAPEVVLEQLRGQRLKLGHPQADDGQADARLHHLQCQQREVVVWELLAADG